MKCTIPEISWHNRDPVLSVDIQPTHGNKNEFYRLASGGSDFHVLIWYMTLNESGSINLDLAADLLRHQKAVNAVKWSPNGELLASGDDDCVIFIWKLKSESEPLNILDTTNEQDKEIWITLKILRGHVEDVYDLSWSPNSQFLISGSVDNTAKIWDVHKGKLMSTLSDHKGFVQGVAWDPQNQYIATLCTDRYLRIYDIQTKKIVSRSSKCTLPVPEGSDLFGKTVRIYHDDTLQTFFRRLSFSPDGKLLIVPAGVVDYDGAVKPLNTTYIYSRYSLKQPSIVLPSPDQYTVAVKCCPNLFKLRPHKEDNSPVVPLPYRIIFAVATKSSVYLYDTQQKMPFGIISNIHYTRLTDLTWSKDGIILIVSSTDGFCSLITFCEGELGELYTQETEQKDTCDSNNCKMEQETIGTLARKTATKIISPSIDSSENISESANQPSEGCKIVSEKEAEKDVFLGVINNEKESMTKAAEYKTDSHEKKIPDKSVKETTTDNSHNSDENRQDSENKKHEEEVVVIDEEKKSKEIDVTEKQVLDKKNNRRTPNKTKGLNWIEVRRKPRTPSKEVPKGVSSDENKTEKGNKIK